MIQAAVRALLAASLARCCAADSAAAACGGLGLAAVCYERGVREGKGSCAEGWTGSHSLAEDALYRTGFEDGYLVGLEAARRQHSSGLVLATRPQSQSAEALHRRGPRVWSPSARQGEPNWVAAKIEFHEEWSVPPAVTLNLANNGGSGGPLLGKPDIPARALSASGASSSSASGGCEQQDGHESHQHETLVLLFVAITIGAMVLHLTTIPVLHSLQFTVLLFVIGAGLGGIAELGGLDVAPLLYRSYRSWVAADPHLLLFTFLPALLCGDAMTIDTHVAQRCSFQCLFLAGPGVVVGSLLTALVCYWVLPYGWDFATSLTVGSILAATDPVAVVSLLKELGASPVLTITIQGESLLNDGIAIVLFSVAYDFAGGGTYTVLRVIEFLVQSTLGAWCLGTMCGILFYIWIRKANDKLNHSSTLLQVTLTIACAYWSFIISEGVFHMSGVLSTVAASLVLAHKMWPVLVERRTMLDIWHVVETIGNTMVFFLAGVLTGRAMLRISAQDYLWLLVVYVAITLIRLTLLCISLPILNRIGERITLKEVLVMTWGGLRGMVGLALAILVQKDLAGGKLSEIDGDRILFLVGSVAALTLIVNATTCPALTRGLGITSTPEGRNALVRNVSRRAQAHVEKLMRDHADDTEASRVCALGLVRELVTRVMHAVEVHQPKGRESLQVRQSRRTMRQTLARPSSKSVVRSSDALGGAQVIPTEARGSGSQSVWGSENMSGPPPRTTSARTSISMKMENNRKSLVEAVKRIIRGKYAPPDIVGLWERFDKAKVDLLNSGCCITAFKFGNQLHEMRRMLAQDDIDTEQLQIVREVFLESVRANYWDQLQSGRFDADGSELRILFHSLDRAKESSHVSLIDWEILRKDIKFDITQEQDAKGRLFSRAATAKLTGTTTSWKTSTQFSNMHKWYDKWRTRRNYRQQAFAVRVINAFIDAHCQAQRHVASFFGANAMVDTPEEAIAIVESQVQVFQAATLRGLIGREMQMRVNTMWTVHCFAEQYRNFVLRVHESGVLQSKEAEQLLHPIAGAMRQLHKERKKIYAAINSDACKSQMTTIEAAAVIQRFIKRMKVRKNINIVRQSVYGTLGHNHCSPKTAGALDTSLLSLKESDETEPTEVGKESGSEVMPLESSSEVMPMETNESVEELSVKGAKPSSDSAEVTSTPVMPMQLAPGMPGATFVDVD
mmetsp:Transcript_106812/g.276083  ORF Transcript_106812/g.276083 Transcript_106812/m.276083 type:complete len:1190 (+) Transcript_106812:47-3616(+)